MKIYSFKRGGGKSIRMLYASEFNDAPIICATESQRKILKEQAKSLGLDIPEPIIAKELNDARTARTTTTVLVDEIPTVLQSVLSGYGSYKIIGGTLTADEGGEDDRSRM